MSNYGDGSWKKTNAGYEYRCFVVDPNTLIRTRHSFYGKTKQICRQKCDAYKIYGSDYKTIFVQYQKYLKDRLNGKPVDLPLLPEESDFLINNKVIPTLLDWSSLWLKTYKKDDVSPTTYKGYMYDLKTLQADAIAQRPIDEIKQIHIKQFFNRISTRSKSFKKKMRFYLNSMFEEALENELCKVNPVRRIKISGEETKRTSLTEDEVKALNEFALTHYFGIPVLLALCSGARRGEMVVIENPLYTNYAMPENPNFSFIDKDGVLHLRGSMTVDHRLVGTTSTKNHERDIPLPSWLFLLIQSNKSKSHFLCHLKDGRQMSPDSFDYHFRKFYDEFLLYCKKKNIKTQKFTPHNLRHTCETMMYRNNVDKYTRMLLLGHSDDQSADRYTHDDDLKMRKKAMILTFEKQSS